MQERFELELGIMYFIINVNMSKFLLQFDAFVNGNKLFINYF